MEVFCTPKREMSPIASQTCCVPDQEWGWALCRDVSGTFNAWARFGRSRFLRNLFNASDYLSTIVVARRNHCFRQHLLPIALELTESFTFSHENMSTMKIFLEKLRRRICFNIWATCVTQASIIWYVPIYRWSSFSSACGVTSLNNESSLNFVKNAVVVVFDPARLRIVWTRPF